MGRVQKVPTIPRRDTSAPTPLSFAQQRLWFIDQLEPGSPAYNVPIGLRLQGSLDIPALRKTLNEVVRRHESLRTVFPRAEEPVQVVLPALTIDLPIVEADEATVESLMIEEAQTPFNLRTGPLLRAKLLRLGKDDHVALFTMHHIVSDGWSIGILVHEVATLYKSYAAGAESPLNELPIQYGDYAVWQRNWLQGEVLEGQVSYWKQQLADAPELLELPIDHPRAAVQSQRGTQRRFTFSPELTAGLKELSRREDATLFMTTLAAFQALLYRYTHQQDILIGTPIANRTRIETEPLIGFFVNTLVLRGRVNGAASFSELLKQVRESTLSAYLHQDVPFEQVVDELRPQRSLSHTPLFQVMFALQNAPQQELELDGLRLSAVEAISGTAKFDLNLSLLEAQGELRGALEYNTDLFEATTIEQMLVHYERILHSIVNDPNQRLSELRLLDKAEEQKVLVEFNETMPAQYDWNQCVHALFEQQVKRSPAAIAVVFEQEEVTYAELNAKANQLARKLRQLGVTEESIVGVLMERSVELVISLLAVMKAGGAYLPLDPEYPTERLEFMFADAKPRVLLTQERLAEEARVVVGETPVVSVDGQRDELAQFDDSDLQQTVRADQLIYVIYTSGSTGKPKAAMNEHRAVANRLLWMVQRYGLSSSDAIVQKTPFTFDVSGWEFFCPLVSGGRLVVARPGGHREPRYLVQLIQTQNVTITHFVPAMLRAFLDHEAARTCRSLRMMVSSGEALSEELERLVFERLPWVSLENLYGPTETAIEVTGWSCGSGDQPRTIEGSNGWVTIGAPIVNVTAYVLDRSLRPVPLGVRGELFIGGVAVGRGYLNRAALTAERFIPDNFSAEAGARLYRTGDLVRQRRDGSIEYIGRLDDQIKLRGHRIELGEIEAALMGHEAVAGAVVQVKSDAHGEARLVAYFTVNASVSVAELREHLRGLLPEYMLPAVFVKLEEFALNASGKVNRKALPEPPGAAVESEYEAPRTPVEQKLCDIWAEVLPVERVGINESFFDLGGHSLLATQVISRVHVEFGVEVSMRDFFTTPTVAGLAVNVVRTQGQASAGGDEELERLLAELEALTI